jgi:hypothetical protein
MPLHTFVEIKDNDIFCSNPMMPFDSDATTIPLPHGVRRLLVFPSSSRALLHFGPSVGSVFLFEVEKFVDNNRYLAWINTTFEIVGKGDRRIRKEQCAYEIGFTVLDALTQFNIKNPTKHVFYMQFPCFPKTHSIRTQIGDKVFVENLLKGMEDAWMQSSSPMVELGLQDLRAKL